MSFDPQLFGQAMGEAIQKAVEPLKAQIADLSDQLSKAQEENSALREMVESLPAPQDGKSFTLEDAQPVIDAAIALIVEEAEQSISDAVTKAVAEIPTPKDGKNGVDGKDGASLTLEDVQPVIEKSIELIREEAEGAYQKALDALPTPKDGRDGVDGKDGEKGERGADGAGIADLMIDRAGELVATFTDGRMKNLGPVIGRDGKDGENGKDGVSLEDFELEYLPDTHEIRITAQAGDVRKSVTYPAGGIHGKGYWRDGNESQAGEAWTHDGCLWVAREKTRERPCAQSDKWFLAARKGRDGESVIRRVQSGPAQPIRLKETGDESGND